LETLFGDKTEMQAFATGTTGLTCVVFTGWSLSQNIKLFLTNEKQSNLLLVVIFHLTCMLSLLVATLLCCHTMKLLATRVRCCNFFQILEGNSFLGFNEHFWGKKNCLLHFSLAARRCSENVKIDNARFLKCSVGFADFNLV